MRRRVQVSWHTSMSYYDIDTSRSRHEFSPRQVQEKPKKKAIIIKRTLMVLPKVKPKQIKSPVNKLKRISESMEVETFFQPYSVNTEQIVCNHLKRESIFKQPRKSKINFQSPLIEDRSKLRCFRDSKSMHNLTPLSSQTKFTSTPARSDHTHTHRLCHSVHSKSKSPKPQTSPFS